jgi:exosortase
MTIKSSATPAVDRPSPNGRLKRFLGDARPSSAIGIVLIGVAIVCLYFGTLVHLVGRWTHEPDYSHGFLVPLFAGWLLWQRRARIARRGEGEPVAGRWLGAVLLAASGVLRLFAIYFNFILAEPVALIVCVAGVIVLIAGMTGLRWAWPAIVFLFFMIPLPGAIAGRLSAPLQSIATTSSTYVLQTIGMPAIATGNVIWLTHGKIGVVEACSGLRMLMMFGAVTMAAVLVLNLAKWERICLLLSSAGIAIAANVFRIVLTGVAHEVFGPQLADKVFHDLAGWIMMPVAIVMMGLEVMLLSKLFLTEDKRPLIVAQQAERAVRAIRPR